MFAILEMEPQINGHLLEMSLYNMTNFNTSIKNKYTIK